MNPAPEPGEGRAAPVLLALIAALIWGIWWIPVRALEARGLEGALGGVTMSLGAMIAALLALSLRRRVIRVRGPALIGASLAGVAVATYSAAINHSDVVRVVLLFYLAPAWGKLIEWLFLGLPWRWTSTVALIAALSGAYLVLGGEVAPGALNAGDLLALASGLAWASGSAMIFSGGRSDSLSLTCATCGFAALAGIVLATFDTGLTWPPGIGGTVGLGMMAGVLYVLPIMALTLWSAQRLPPATLSFLLTAEILAGVVSSAVLLGEPFGWMQAAGAALIVFGALAELLPSARQITQV